MTPQAAGNQSNRIASLWKRCTCSSYRRPHTVASSRFVHSCCQYICCARGERLSEIETNAIAIHNSVQTPTSQQQTSRLVSATQLPLVIYIRIRKWCDQRPCESRRFVTAETYRCKSLKPDQGSVPSITPSVIIYLWNFPLKGCSSRRSVSDSPHIQFAVHPPVRPGVGK